MDAERPWIGESADLRFAAMALAFFAIELPALLPAEIDEWIDEEPLHDHRFVSCCHCMDDDPPRPRVEPNPPLPSEDVQSLLEGHAPAVRHPDLVHLRAEAIALHDEIVMVVQVDGIPARIVDVELGAGGEWTSISGSEAWDDRATREHGSAAWVFVLPDDATSSSVAVTTERFDVERRVGTWVAWRPSLADASESARHAIARTLSSLRWRVRPS